MNSPRTIPQEKQNIIIQAAKEFPSKSGNVLWTQALEKHPEWGPMLLDPNLDPATALNRLYPLTSHMRDKGLFGDEMKARSKDRKTHRENGTGRVAWNKGVKTGPKGKRGSRGSQQMQLYKNGDHQHPQVVSAVAAGHVAVNFCPNCAGPVGVLTDAANLINTARQSGITMQQLRVAIDAMLKSGVV